MATLDYEIAPRAPASHRVRVILTTSVEAGEAVRLRLPSWIPGSYVIRDFARHVLSVTAFCDNRAIDVVAIDRHTWECLPDTTELRVVCEFYARDASVRAAFLDERRALFNFTSLCLRPIGAETRACRIRLEPPADIDGWTLATPLTATCIDARGFGDYRADSYWDLIDQPVAMGAAVERVAFEVRGVAHAFVLLGAHDADTARIAADLAAVCAAQARVFDHLPAREYLFLAVLTGRGYGGLEHRESSVLQVARDALPSAAARDEQRSEAYQTLLGLCSHEYFHLWNVKRIRPRAVAESDLAQEAYFRDLWAYEGVTSYYDDLALVRAGVIDEHAYLERLAKLATRLERTPGRSVQSLAQSSFDAWLKFYRPDANTPNAVVSYYGKGAQLALALDLKLRVDTDERATLDAVMRRAWQDHGAHDAPVPENGLARLAEAVSGLDLEGFFKRHLDSTADTSWAQRLEDFGVRATRGPGQDERSVVRGRLGLELTGTCQPRVIHVFDDGPARGAGISPDDRLLALDGLEIDDAVHARLKRYPAGAVLRLHLFRGDELLVREVVAAEHAASEWRLVVDDDADAAAHARRARWLHHAGTT